jgi:hypothetical protein
LFTIPSPSTSPAHTPLDRFDREELWFCAPDRIPLDRFDREELWFCASIRLVVAHPSSSICCPAAVTVGGTFRTSIALDSYSGFVEL